MTNTQMLIEKILNSGLKKAKIAEMVGITRYSLLRKIKNQSKFKSSEIQLLCKILEICDLDEKVAIFFAPTQIN